MTRLAAVLAIILLIGCASDAPPPSLAQDSGLVSRMENAIAAKLLGQAAALLDIDGATPLAKLGALLDQLERDVDAGRLNARNLREWRALEYIVAAERAARREETYPDIVQRLSSVVPDLNVLPWQINGELDRIDALLTDKNPTLVKGEFIYPDDSRDGRQRYLDTLAAALLDARTRWAGSIERAAETDIAIIGFEDQGVSTSFSYDPRLGELRVNLTDVTRLPRFELEGLAARYGFPGAHTLATQARARPVQRHLALPGYTEGWGLHMMRVIGDGTPSAGWLAHLRLRVSLALADLGLHQRDWSRAQVGAFLAQNAHYSESRVELALRDVEANPGVHLAAFIGYWQFQERLDACMARSDCDAATFHQLVVDLGPVTFDQLDEALTQAESQER